jgi:hypothetical protein
MPFANVWSLWPGDPLSGVIVGGSGLLLAWTLLAALIGCLLGFLHELDRPQRIQSYRPDPTSGSSRPRFSTPVALSPSNRHVVAAR